MVRAILNKSWKQHPSKQQLYGHLPPISKTIQIRRTRYVGHWWRSKDELINDVLLWTPSHGRTTVGRPARIYIQQLCADTGCSLEDPQEAMDERDRSLERVRKIHVRDTTWWWWWCVCVFFVCVRACVRACVCVCVCVLRAKNLQFARLMNFQLGANDRVTTLKWRHFYIRSFILPSQLGL